MMKSKNGITLIALVITIVVLIILAGVAINLTLGDNGIFKKATTAREDYGIAAAREKLELKIAELQAEKQGKATLEELVEHLKDDPNAEYTVSLTEIIATLTSDITVGDAEEIYVVYNKYQFNINKNLKINYVSKVNGTEETEEGPDVAYDNPYIPNGFKHVEGTTWNAGYTIIGETQSIGNEFVWVPCVLKSNAKSRTDNVVTFKKIVTGKYNSDSLKIRPENASEVAEEDISVEEIKTSVGKYGGFYIAKYEPGVPNTTASTSTNDPEKQDQTGKVKPLSKPGVGVWNYISRENAITLSKSMIDTATTGAKSTLISGEAWDTTLVWITATADDTYAENSLGKGWYNGVSGRKVNHTGYYSVNNIFDLGGNVYEWTTENCVGTGNGAFVGRGGCAFGNGDLYPAAFRCNYLGIGDGTSFRVVMYK